MNAGQQAPQSFLQNLFEPTLRIIVIDQRNPPTPNCSLLTPRMWKPPAILAAIWYCHWEVACSTVALRFTPSIRTRVQLPICGVRADSQNPFSACQWISPPNEQHSSADCDMSAVEISGLSLPFPFETSKYLNFLMFIYTIIHSFNRPRRGRHNIHSTTYCRTNHQNNNTKI